MTMKQPGSFIPFSLPSIGIEEEEAVLRVLRSGWLTTGKEALALKVLYSPAALCAAVNLQQAEACYEACGIQKIRTRPSLSSYIFCGTSHNAIHAAT